MSPSREFAVASVLGDIVDRAKKNPGHLAAKDLDRELTYGELIDEVVRIGEGLRKRGVREGDRIAILIPNSVDFVTTSLACLWVGAVFVPLSVTDPPSRLETVLSDCEPLMVIVSARDTAVVALLDGYSLVPVDQLRQESRASTRVADNPTRVAYMIYTSGTTGKPKGVQIGSAAFATAVTSTAQALGLSAATRTLCVSPFHFDGSYANLFPTLISGGMVIMRPRDSLLFPRVFFNTVAQEGVTYSGFTPSYLRLLLASRQMSDLNGSTLQTLAFGGEPLPVADLRSLWSLVPSMRVFNRYGPTEATIAVTNVELTPEMVAGGTVTIGRPHPGVSFVLVDDVGGAVEEPDRVGELYIGGAQLMAGYWADPVLTSGVMRDDVVPGETLYKTGDLVYRDQSDNYVYVGRADRVIKRSGVRISLLELSEAMGKLDAVTSSACLVFDREGELGIVAFVTTNAEISEAELRHAARKLIPDNMVPDRIERVSAMPLNSSNQLDEKKLLSITGLRPLR